MVQPGQVLKLLCARIISKRPATVFVKASPNGYLIKVSLILLDSMAVLPRAAQWPHYQAPMAVLSRPAQFGHFVKSNPIAILSRPAPMAILLSKSNGKFIKDSPRATSSRQPQWLFYQGKLPSHQSQLPLYQIKAGFLKPATAIYQGQPQPQLYDGCGGKGQPLGLALGGPSRYCADLIEAGPDGQFINAASNRKGQPLDLVLGGSTRSLSTAGRPRI